MLWAVVPVNAFDRRDRVAEQACDVVERNAGLQQVRRPAVPQDMRVGFMAETDRLHVPAEHAVHILVVAPEKFVRRLDKQLLDYRPDLWVQRDDWPALLRAPLGRRLVRGRQ